MSQHGHHHGHHHAHHHSHGRVADLIPNPAIVGDVPTATTLGHDVVTMSRDMHGAATAELQRHEQELARMAAEQQPEAPMKPISMPRPQPRPTKNLPRAVLVAVDESEPSRRALIWAIDNFDGEEVVLNVVSCISGSVDSMMPEDAQKLELARLVSDEERRLATWVAPVFEEKNSTLTYRVSVAVGEPNEQLCKLAEELNVRVVVVGSHGKGAIRKALLGSVSDYLTHNCTRPVLVVRDGQ
eukprot:m.226252 g.226252  ORF g.226252 m.226252 type:complete len:241 (-) comp16902_c0_seq1:26-748(-)